MTERPVGRGLLPLRCEARNAGMLLLAAEGPVLIIEAAIAASSTRLDASLDQK